VVDTTNELPSNIYNLPKIKNHIVSPIKKAPEAIIGSLILLSNIVINLTLPVDGYVFRTGIWLIGSVLFFVGLSIAGYRYSILEKIPEKYQFLVPYTVPSPIMTKITKVFVGLWSFIIGLFFFRLNSTNDSRIDFLDMTLSNRSHIYIAYYYEDSGCS